MIEADLRNYLDSQLTADVYLGVPQNLPEKCVILDRIGGGLRNRINSARFAIQSYADSLKNAAALNEEVKAALDSGGIHTFCMAAKLENDYNFTDTERREYRYQAIFDFYY